MGDVVGMPDDPVLAEAARMLQETKQWGWVVDSRWQVVFISDESVLSFGEDRSLIRGELYGPAWVEHTLRLRFGANTIELQEEMLRGLGRLMLTDLGRAGLETHLDPRLVPVVDELEPADASFLIFRTRGVSATGDLVEGKQVVTRVRDGDGRIAGTVVAFHLDVGATTVGQRLGSSDLGHLERMQRLSAAQRRPAAILFADLEGSSPLARRLSTSAYFSLNRRIVREADRAVVGAQGLVGRHSGDGVVAFFLAEDTGSESSACRAAIHAARSIQDSLAGIAQRSGLEPDDIVMRIGLHWGATLYVGSIITAGRSEVTALGAEVNQAARIEACATGGRVLASRDLLERLDPHDATELGIDPTATVYTALADLPHATEKARRDAPAISVAQI